MTALRGALCSPSVADRPEGRPHPQSPCRPSRGLFGALASCTTHRQGLRPRTPGLGSRMAGVGRGWWSSRRVVTQGRSVGRRTPSRTAAARPSGWTNKLRPAPRSILSKRDQPEFLRPGPLTGYDNRHCGQACRRDGMTTRSSFRTPSRASPRSAGAPRVLAPLRGATRLHHKCTDDTLVRTPWASHTHTKRLEFESSGQRIPPSS
jgi:hypothetical protein